jgi:protein arginine kinase activator
LARPGRGGGGAALNRPRRSSKIGGDKTIGTSDVNRKCDQCEKRATHHSVEIIKGQKIEKHLCDEHAAAAGLSVMKAVPTPINELLTNFVKMHSGTPAGTEPKCENCGLTFAEFRDSSLLGCPQCYSAFEAQLGPLLERTHEGASHHVGKTPNRAGAGQQKQQMLLRLRKRLSDAVAAEDYEQAAKLRDEIGQQEG